MLRDQEGGHHIGKANQRKFPTGHKSPASSAILQIPDTVIEIKRSKAIAKLVNQRTITKTGEVHFGSSSAFK